MTFQQFYRDEYLPRHADSVCKALHVLGIPASLAFVVIVVWLREWWLLVLLPVPAYLLGWIGHLWARNHPTFFTHPLWSFKAYWRMMAALGGRPSTSTVRTR